MKIQCSFFSLILLFACSKSPDTPIPTPPSVSKISISDVSQTRTVSNSTFHFNVVLDKLSTSAITVHYTTIAGTAIENKDYTAATGTLTIPANQSYGTIDVIVSGDSLRSTNQIFYVQIDNPTNATLTSNVKATGTIINEDGLYFPVDNTGYLTPTSYPNYTLIWSDEFTGNTINNNNWLFESGNNNGWGNSELENYTNRIQNTFVSNGNLIIEARKESYGGFNYTSARMITKNKQSFKFGRIDIRAKTPTGKGIWPALWMLGNNIDAVGWPTCGEIDMMEILGHEPNKLYGTLHWGSSAATHASKGSSYVLNGSSFNQQFHVYSMEWKQDAINLLIDDVKYLTVTNTDIAITNPFNNPFFFIFNIAVGGNWPGSPDGTTVFPQRMIVDYIRVFQ